MTAQAVIGILAVSLALCLTALAAGMVYFLWQWKKLDRILDSFQQWSEDGGMQGKDGCPLPQGNQRTALAPGRK